VRITASRQELPKAAHRIELFILKWMTLMKTKLALCTALACLLSAGGCKQAASPEQQATSNAPDAVVKEAAAVYTYLYPLAVFGVSNEALTNVEKPTWETLSAPINQFMSVRESRPDNHGVILPSTDTLYTLAWTDVTKEPVVFTTPAIPNVPGTTKKRFMMYEFMDAWTKVYYSNGLQKGLVKKTSFIMVGPDFKGDLPKIPHSIVVHCTTNQSWLIVRTQVEGLNDLNNVHAVQDQYDLRPLSAYGKPFTQPNGTVDPNIPVTPGPSPQANALSGEKFLIKAAEWFNKVPFPDEDKAAGVDKQLAEFGIVHGQPFDYSALSVEKKAAFDLATKIVQHAFDKIAADPASIGDNKQGWLIPNPHLGNYGTDYQLRAGIAFVGFGANLPEDGYYPFLVQDSKGNTLDGGKKYTITFPKGQLPPAGGFWSVTNYQNHFLIPGTTKFSVSDWMNPKHNPDGSLTIYLQPTSPGADKELNWIPTSASIPMMTPLMRLYWPLPPALDGRWYPPPAVEVQ
jgi:hypothetical protein